MVAVVLRRHLVLFDVATVAVVVAFEVAADAVASYDIVGSAVATWSGVAVTGSRDSFEGVAAAVIAVATNRMMVWAAPVQRDPVTGPDRNRVCNVSIVLTHLAGVDTVVEDQLPFAS